MSCILPQRPSIVLCTKYILSTCQFNCVQERMHSVTAKGMGMESVSSYESQDLENVDQLL